VSVAYSESARETDPLFGVVRVECLVGDRADGQRGPGGARDVQQHASSARPSVSKRRWCGYSSNVTCKPHPRSTPAPCASTAGRGGDLRGVRSSRDS
jgi:hypothetical protein